MPPSLPPPSDDHTEDDSEFASQNDLNTVKVLSGRKSADCLSGGVLTDEAIGRFYNPDAKMAADKYLADVLRRRIFKNAAVKQYLNGKILEPLDMFLKVAIKYRNCDCNRLEVERSCNSGGCSLIVSSAWKFTINVDRLDLLQTILKTFLRINVN